MLAARTAQHRLQSSGQRRLAQQRSHLRGIGLAPLKNCCCNKIGFVVFREDIEQRGAPGRHLVEHLLGYGLQLECLTEIFRVVPDELLVDQIDHRFKRMTRIVGSAGTHRNHNRNRPAVETLAYFCHCVIKIGAHHVHLVDKGKARNRVAVGLPPHRFGLGFHAFLGIKHHHATIEHTQTAFDFGCEIDVPGGVDQVDDATFPLQGNAGGINRDAAFLLFFVVVGCCVTAIDRAKPVDGAGVVQNVFGCGGFACVDMGNDSQVANPGEVERRLGHHRLRQAGAKTNSAGLPARAGKAG